MPGALYRRSLSNKERHSNDYFGSCEETPFPNNMRPFTEKRCRFTPCKHIWQKPSQSQISQMLKMRKDQCKADYIEQRKHGQTWEINDIKSCDSESDIDNHLAAMVHDFIENGTYNNDNLEDREMDGGLISGADEICDAVKALTSSTALPLEKNLKCIVDLLLSIEDLKENFGKVENTDRQGDMRRFVVKHLWFLGFNAASCITKWHNSCIIPGGEYEYIDVLLDSAHAHIHERVVIDLDFKSQFEIARPTAHYMAIFKLIPNIFIGVSEKLEQFLQIISEAVKHSLKQHGMPLPPWRTLEYMHAKWLTVPYDRIILHPIAYTRLTHERSQLRRKSQSYESIKRGKATTSLIKHN